MLLHQRPPRTTGIFAAVASVALATLAIYFLRRVAPVVSLSVVYLPAILLISTFWGLTLGLFTSVLSAAAFNFFHIPPTGGFTIIDSRNWVALAAFMIVAVVASTISNLARSRAEEAERRRGEADLAAGTARALLGGATLADALPEAGRLIGAALGLGHVAIVLDPATGRDAPSGVPLDLGDGRWWRSTMPLRRSPAALRRRGRWRSA